MNDHPFRYFAQCGGVLAELTDIKDGRPLYGAADPVVGIRGTCVACGHTHYAEAVIAVPPKEQPLKH